MTYTTHSQSWRRAAGPARAKDANACRCCGLRRWRRIVETTKGVLWLCADCYRRNR